MVTFEQLEGIRLQLKKKYTTFIIIGVVIVLIGLVIFLAYDFEPILIVLGPVLTFLIAMIFCHKQAREYKLAFKDYFVKSSLKKIFTSLRYQPENGISRATIASTNMMRMGDRYSSNDLITGRYKDIGFTQSDVHADVEEHLQAARRLYNANISSFNQMIVTFPTSVIAGMKGLTKKEFFEAEEAKKEDVKMEF